MLQGLFPPTPSPFGAGGGEGHPFLCFYRSKFDTEFDNPNIIAFEVRFPEGSLPKIGNALIIFHILRIFETRIEAPLFLEVSEILNENTIRAIRQTSRRSIGEMIQDLPLGIAVIDTGKPAEF